VDSITLGILLQIILFSLRTASKLSSAIAEDNYARLVSFILIHLLYLNKLVVVE
jgi:hypothetical protein